MSQQNECLNCSNPSQKPYAYCEKCIQVIDSNKARLLDTIINETITRMTLILLICFLAVGSIACKDNVQQDAKNLSTVEQKAKANNTSHACNAITKKGAPCTRKVSNVQGESAKCWQHRDK